MGEPVAVAQTIGGDETKRTIPPAAAGWRRRGGQEVLRFGAAGEASDRRRVAGVSGSAADRAAAATPRPLLAAVRHVAASPVGVVRNNLGLFVSVVIFVLALGLLVGRSAGARASQVAALVLPLAVALALLAVFAATVAVYWVARRGLRELDDEWAEAFGALTATDVRAWRRLAERSDGRISDTEPAWARLEVALDEATVSTVGDLPEDLFWLHAQGLALYLDVEQLRSGAPWYVEAGQPYRRLPEARWTEARERLQRVVKRCDPFAFEPAQEASGRLLQTCAWNLAEDEYAAFASCVTEEKALVAALDGQGALRPVVWEIRLTDYPFHALAGDEDWGSVVETVMWSPEGRWALVTSNEGHSVVAGPPNVVSCVDDALGDLNGERPSLVELVDLVYVGRDDTTALDEGVMAMVSRLYGTDAAEDARRQLVPPPGSLGG